MRPGHKSPYGKSTSRLHALRREARAARKAYLAGKPIPEGSVIASTPSPGQAVGPTAPVHPISTDDPEAAVRQAATAARRHYKAKSRTTRKVVERLMRKGESPVEFLTRMYRDESLSTSARLEAAIAAAPYFHPKLASTTLDLAGGVSVRAVRYAPEGGGGEKPAVAASIRGEGATAPPALPAPGDDEPPADPYNDEI